MDVLSWSRHHRLFPGEGDFDLGQFVVHLVRAGYAGPLSLEVFNDTFRQTDTRRTAAHALRSLVWLAGPRRPAPRRAVRPGADPRRACRRSGPTSSRSRPRTPPRSRRSWTTSASPSAASTAPSRCGCGLRARPGSSSTSSTRAASRPARAGRLPGRGAAATEDRARALAVRPVPRRAQADEQRLAAFAAPNGLEVFLTEPPAADGAGLGHGVRARLRGGGLTPRAVDHVNLAHAWEEHDEAVLFYTSVLGLRGASRGGGRQPQGLVRSRVMRTAGRWRAAAAQRRADGEPALPRARRARLRRHRRVARAGTPAGHGLPADPATTTTTTSRRASAWSRRTSTGCASPAALRPHARTASSCTSTPAGSVGSSSRWSSGPRRYDGYGADNAPVRLAAQARLDR